MVGGKAPEADALEKCGSVRYRTVPFFAPLLVDNCLFTSTALFNN
jgi:hypothetical protein